MPDIHPTAIVEPGAAVAGDAVIGPYCVVSARATIGAGAVLISHVAVQGRTSIGASVTVHPFAVLGGPPQSTGYKGEDTALIVGPGCQIREHVTMNPGMANARGETRVGERCFFMAGSHVGHDCIVGDGVIVANNVMLAGHVEVGDGAWIGGGAAIHQFARVGRGAMVGGMSGLEGDLIPFGLCMGNRAHLAGLNLVGLKRRGLARQTIQTMRAAFSALFEGQGGIRDRLDDVAERFGAVPEVAEILAFVRKGGDRPLCVPGR